MSSFADCINSQSGLSACEKQFLIYAETLGLGTISETLDGLQTAADALELGISKLNNMIGQVNSQIDALQEKVDSVTSISTDMTDWLALFGPCAGITTLVADMESRKSEFIAEKLFKETGITGLQAKLTGMQAALSGYNTVLANNAGIQAALSSCLI